MGTAFKLTAGDLLHRPHFQKARVVAGEKGFGRVIRWVHIVEVAEIGQLLNGNELILSTGVGWSENEELSCSFLKQLIDKGVSGLCVELGTYVTSIPAEMKKLAERNAFPLIVFEEEVRFVDITQDLNGLLIESQYKMMSDLEAFSNQLNHLLLSTDAFKKILRLLHQYLRVQVVYIPVEGEPECFPTVVPLSEREKLVAQVHSGSPGGSFISQPIRALGHQFAVLAVFSPNEAWTDFDSLVLDRTATALAQEQMRVLYIEEKRKSAEQRWIETWLSGKPDKKEIEQHLLTMEPSIQPNGCVACLLKSNFSEDQTSLAYYTMVFRSIFERQGFFLFVTFEHDQMTFTLVNKRKISDWKYRIGRALDEIQNKGLIEKKKGKRLRFAVGKCFGELDRLQESYRMAQEVLTIQETTGKMDMLFYDELYIFRLISKLERKGEIRPFVIDHIGPVLDFDEKHHSQMFKTLKVFLAVNGSKKEAAEQLYVVRQTLYHRIEKLKELLGEDFMMPNKRLAIEFAIYAQEFME